MSRGTDRTRSPPRPAFRASTDSPGRPPRSSASSRLVNDSSLSHTPSVCESPATRMRRSGRSAMTSSSSRSPSSLVRWTHAPAGCSGHGWLSSTCGLYRYWTCGSGIVMPRPLVNRWPRQGVRTKAEAGWRGSSSSSTLRSIGAIGAIGAARSGARSRVGCGHPALAGDSEDSLRLTVRSSDRPTQARAPTTRPAATAVARSFLVAGEATRPFSNVGRPWASGVRPLRHSRDLGQRLPGPSAAAGFDLSPVGPEGQKDGLFFLGANDRRASPWGGGDELPACRAAGDPRRLGRSAAR